MRAWANSEDYRSLSDHLGQLEKADYLKEFITPDQSQHQGVPGSGGGRSMALPFGIINGIHAMRITGNPS